MKRFISIVLSLVILVGIFTFTPINAGAVTSGCYTYGFIGSKGIEIEQYSGGGETVDIPTEIDGYTVISIGDYAFYRSGCTKVNIPNTVTNIGRQAFEFSSLTEVTIPNKVTNIGYCAFSHSQLKKVTIENNVKTIGSSAFYGCTSLQEVTIGNNVKTIEGYAFYNCTGLTTVKIPDNVTEICYSAFRNCIGLSNLSIGKKVKTIGEYAFFGCTSLQEIKIGENVNNIEDSAFQNCDSLKRVDIPKSVKNLHFYAFYGCKKLSNIYYNGTNHDWEKILGYEYGYVGKNYKFENAKVHFLKKVNLSKCKVFTIAKQHYTGKKIKPYITIKDRRFYLFDSIDYKASYKKNKNIGKATVIIKGKGCYTGKIKKTFRIVKGINPMKVISARNFFTTYTYRDSTFKDVIKVKKAQGKVSYKKISGNSRITVNSKTGFLTIKKGLKERYYDTRIKVTASGNKKYKRGSKIVSIVFWAANN